MALLGSTIKKPEIIKSDPNLRELPKSTKPLVAVGSKEYVIKGDGPCLLRTTAAHIPGDQDEGPNLPGTLTHIYLSTDQFMSKKCVVKTSP